MRKQYHFKHASDGVLIWDVDDLVTMSETLPVIEVSLSEIGELDENYWYQEKDSIPTCRSICEHLRLINETDLDYPIILNADGSVMDGMHRVCKAFLMGAKKIKAKKFRKPPEPKFRNRAPDDLPY